MPSMYDVSFNVSSQVSGTMAIINIEPKGWDGYYHVQIAPDDSLYFIEPGESPSEGWIRNVASTIYDKARQTIASGSTVDQFLRATCYQGPKQIHVPLETGKRYMVIVFAVESENGSIPVMRSIPTFKYL